MAHELVFAEGNNWQNAHGHAEIVDIFFAGRKNKKHYAYDKVNFYYEKPKRLITQSWKAIKFNRSFYFLFREFIFLKPTGTMRFSEESHDSNFFRKLLREAKKPTNFVFGPPLFGIETFETPEFYRLGAGKLVRKWNPDFNKKGIAKIVNLFEASYYLESWGFEAVRPTSLHLTEKGAKLKLHGKEAPERERKFAVKFEDGTHIILNPLDHVQVLEPR